jgi:hypothetical protein
MRYRKIVLVLALAGVAWLGSAALAQGQQVPAAPDHGKRMEGLAAIGPGLLHDHMEGMVKQLSGALKQMAALVGSGRMVAERMQRMGALMADVADMLGEMPAIEARARQTPDLAMRDMSVMMKRLADLTQQMSELQSAMP